LTAAQSSIELVDTPRFGDAAFRSYPLLGEFPIPDADFVALVDLLCCFASATELPVL
jgi:hypothetical protein